MAGSGGLVEELRHSVEVVEGDESYSKDWWPYFSVGGAAGSRVVAVARPRTEDEVAATLKTCAKWGVGVTCRGGGSSVTGASVPTGTVVLDMRHMNRVLKVDTENMFVEAEAGIKLSELEAHLNSLGYTLGQFPQSFHLATVGGFLSTRGTGEYSGKYGGAEQMCLSLRVVLADGSVAETRPTYAPRSSVGPDLSALFVGSEGTLGVIVAARLRIHRLDKHVLKLAYSFPSYPDALLAAKTLVGLDVAPAVCRAYDEADAAVTLGANRPTMLLIYGFSSKRVLEAVKQEVEEAMRGRGAREEDAGLVDRWLDNRFRYREALSALSAMGYVAETADLAASWTSLPKLYGELRSQLAAVGGVGGVGAHVSHIYPQGACLYLTIVMRPRAQTYREVWEKIREACRAHGATVSHHHGVGLLKAGMAKEELPHRLLAKIKRALDPENTLNPGKLV